jgi:hypothetical protein
LVGLWRAPRNNTKSSKKRIAETKKGFHDIAYKRDANPRAQRKKSQHAKNDSTLLDRTLPSPTLQVQDPSEPTLLDLTRAKQTLFYHTTTRGPSVRHRRSTRSLARVPVAPSTPWARGSPKKSPPGGKTGPESWHRSSRTRTLRWVQVYPKTPLHFHKRPQAMLTSPQHRTETCPQIPNHHALAYHYVLLFPAAEAANLVSRLWFCD